jgi:hypothetical protein
VSELSAQSLRFELRSLSVFVSLEKEGESGQIFETFLFGERNRFIGNVPGEANIRKNRVKI